MVPRLGVGDDDCACVNMDVDAKRGGPCLCVDEEETRGLNLVGMSKPYWADVCAAFWCRRALAVTICA